MKEGMENRGPQGRRWRRLDNTGKLFPLIANENLSNVFRISATLKEAVDPEVLEQALLEVLPSFPGFRVKLKRGFFWYYFETNPRKPHVEEEADYPCHYIDPKSNQLFLFRVSYFKRRINLEVFHALTDGLGAANFLRELTCRYLQLKAEETKRPDGEEEVRQKPQQRGFEDSYLKNYRKRPAKRYSSRPAVQMTGTVLKKGGENIIHGRVSVSQLKAVCRERKVSITKFLTAVLIWSIYEEYLGGQPAKRHIGVNLPINLRAFFDSTTVSNFFAVTGIDFRPDREHISLEEILEEVSRQMDEKIVREKLEETIAYNVSREKKWYVRVIPLCVKWLALGPIFRRSDRAHTITLSNIGPIEIDEAYRDDILDFQMLIGVSRQQPAKCGVCSYGDRMVISFATIFADCRLADRFFGKLKEEGVPAELESNGTAKPEAFRRNYPLVGISLDRWNSCKKANPGKGVMFLTVILLILMVLTDCIVGYTGWSLNFGVPAVLLLADLSILLLILVNRTNWQSYLMYQLAVTVLSLIPLIFCGVGWIARPVGAVAEAVLSVVLLGITILVGRRSVKNELIRRFHL